MKPKKEITLDGKQKKKATLKGRPKTPPPRKMKITKNSILGPGTVDNQSENHKLPVIKGTRLDAGRDLYFPKLWNVPTKAASKPHDGKPRIVKVKKVISRRTY